MILFRGKTCKFGWHHLNLQRNEPRTDSMVKESDLAPVFPPLLSAFKYDTSRKTVRDKCDHSRLCALLQMWWLHTTMQHNGKWHSWVRIISQMNAFFRSHYSDVPTRAQQTHPTTNAGIWRGGGFLSLSWHDKSVCISTPFITSLPRQWIEFQKPINKGDVHSAWQLSQGNVPLSFAPPTTTTTSLYPHPSLLLLLPLFWNKSGKRWKLKLGRKSWEKKRSRGDETPPCSGSPFIGAIKGKHQGQERMLGFFIFLFFFVNWMRFLRVIVRSCSPERCLEERGVVSQHNKYSYLLLSL